MLAPWVETGLALDASQPMLVVAAARLKQSGHQNWWTAVADHRRLPVADRVADVVIAGWSICYLVAWNAKTWQAEVEQALAEMKRALRPGGTLVILETLGTGHETPYRPEPLAAYYRLLEEMGFSSTWIRTDYQFESVHEAAELTGFFFGEELADRVIREKLVILPECTGIWRLTGL
jgi:ubiquinone/menaquinone biosynthesis C-methylase UbiE